MMRLRPRSSIRVARRRERGIALFVALIAMVLLSLSGIALVRSVDTTNSVAGNIAFRQGSIGPVNKAIEMAINDLFKAKTIALQNVNDLGHGYYAILQPGESANGVPAVLAGDYVTMKAAYTAAGLPVVAADPITRMEVRSVIERVCNGAGQPAGGPWGVTIGTCDTLPPKVSPAATDNKIPLPLPPIPNFRVTVRVDLPNNNTVSHAQAFVR
jgi:type IV pilus assembly protein PilX